MIYVVTGLDKLLPVGREASDYKVSFDSVELVDSVEFVESDERLSESDEVLSDSVDYNYLKV